MTHFYDCQMKATRAAQARGLTMFDTPFTIDEGWAVEPTSGPQAEWALIWATGRSFVTHVGERLGRPLIRVSCALDELTPEDEIPSEFIVEGQLPSLWLCDSEVAFHYGNKFFKTGAGGSRNSSTTDARLNPELRAKSTFEGSPVKFVHGMCDDMHAVGDFDRKTAITQAMDAGVTKNTATAQVYRWRKNNDM